MRQKITFQATGQWTLPPLILHPFADAAGPQQLARSSRAGLMLEGMLDPGEATVEDLERTLAEGRMCELRMLYYVGKDIARWIEQCLDFAARDPVLNGSALEYGSFSELLIEETPAEVREKLGRWGVVDYRSIFARALGLYMTFAEPPEAFQLTFEFVRNYFHYADALYHCRIGMARYAAITAENFTFTLYASGEYSRLLEREWA